MKKRELEQLKSQKPAELEKKVAELRLELKKISVKLSSGEENNLKLAKNKKRELAQILTVLNNMSKQKETKKKKGKKQA